MLGRTLYGRGNGHAFIRQLSPAAWFRYNTGITVTGSGVSQWDDQSGNARHLKQGTDANRPSKVNATGSVAVGSGSSFTRATVATVTDFEGCVRNVISGEVRFQNARRVHNLIPTSSATIAVGGNKTVAVGVGVYVFSMGAEPTGTSVITFTGTATGSTGTLTADASSRTAKTLTITGAGTIIATCTVADALEVQLENVTGQSNQNPSEYVSVGALSSPYHGCMVDGVKYFDTTNPNRVSSNVVYSDVPVESCEGYGVGYTNGESGAYFLSDRGSLGVPARYLMAEWIGRLPTYTPASTIALVAQWPNTPNASWLVCLSNTGRLMFNGSADGSTNTDSAVTSTASVTVAADTLAGVRVIKDFVTGDITYWQSTDGGANWTQVGTAQPGAIYSLFNTTSGVFVHAYGTSGASGAAQGQCLRARVWHTNDPTSTPLADFNPRDGWTENLVTGSDAFTTNWTLSNLTKTLAAIVAPDGTTTGVKLEATTTAACTSVCTLAGVGHGAEQRYTVYAHESGDATANFFNLYNATAGASIVSGSLDYTTGVWSYDTGASGVTVTKVANGWWRIDIVGVCPLGANINVYAAFNGGSWPAGTKAYVWHPQLRRVFAFGSPSLDQYVATTSAARRGWYASTTGEFWDMLGMASLRKTMRPRYLPEGATTNLVLQSSTLNTTWTKSGTPVCTEGAAYCGDIPLTLVSDDDAGVTEYVLQNITFTADAAKSVSILVKQGTSTYSLVRLRDTTASADRLVATITWSAGVPVNTCWTGSQERPPEPMGNGVWRIFMLTASVTAANTNALWIYPATDGALSATPTGTIYVGGVQAENATFASSLQPTTTGTAARNKDVMADTSGNAVWGDGAAFKMATDAFTRDQPRTIYALIEQTQGWASAAYLTSGTAAECGITQVTSRPTLGLNAGSAAASNSNAAADSLAVLCAVINGASSSLTVNNGTASTGNAGANNPGGITLFSNQAGAGYFQGTCLEYIDFPTAHDASQRARVISYLRGIGGVA